MIVYVLKEDSRIAFPMNVPDKATWKDFAEACKCDYIDIRNVSPHHKELFGNNYCLIFDEEFLLRETHPVANLLASYLYGAQYHFQWLCGRVLVAKQKNDEIVGLDNNDLEILAKFLGKHVKDIFSLIR